jgi:hypothetical protein
MLLAKFRPRDPDGRISRAIDVGQLMSGWFRRGGDKERLDFGKFRAQIIILRVLQCVYLVLELHSHVLLVLPRSPVSGSFNFSELQ